MRIDPGLKDDLKNYLQKKIQESQERLTIISAYKLSQEEIDRVVSLFPKTSLEPVTIVDSKVVGGLIIKHGSKVIDASLAQTLRTFKKQLYETY